MMRGCRIGGAGRAAARDAKRRRRRLTMAPVAGRREAAVPALVGRLLTRAAPRPGGAAAWTARIELRLAPSPVAAAPAAAAAARIVATPGAEPGMLLVRETLRERIERTVERVLTRNRRAEPRPASPAVTPLAAPPTAKAATSGPRDLEATPARLAERPQFPPLVLAAPTVAPPPAAAAAEPSPAQRSVTAAGPAAAAQLGRPGAAPIHMPRLVDEIVGELERRNRAGRERQGRLA